MVWTFPCLSAPVSTCFCVCASFSNCYYFQSCSFASVIYFCGFVVWVTAGTVLVGLASYRSPILRGPSRGDDVWESSRGILEECLALVKLSGTWRSWHSDSFSFFQLSWSGQVCIRLFILYFFPAFLVCVWTLTMGQAIVTPLTLFLDH